MGFTVAFNLSFAMSFVSAFYVLFYVRERVIHAKHLQLISGVNAFIFWFISFLCDFITFIVTSLGLLITFAALQEEGFDAADSLGNCKYKIKSKFYIINMFQELCFYCFCFLRIPCYHCIILGRICSAYPLQDTQEWRYLTYFQEWQLL